MSLRHLYLLLPLLLLTSCADEPGAYVPPSGPPTAAAPAPTSGEPAPGERLMLRVPAGTMARSAASGSAKLAEVLDEQAAFEVKEREGSWFRIRIGDVDAWVEVTDPVLIRTRTSRPGPREAVAPSPDRIAQARAHMANNGRETRCGPYTLYTDLAPGPRLDACHRLAGQVDSLYEERFGVAPFGSAREAIFLFAQKESFRRFEEQQGGRRGYAAHADAGDGYLALHAELRDEDRILETLVHELTHLVHRRALGGNLPRWLSEGLADGLGDSAGLSGFEPLEGARGAEGEAKRLLAARTGGLARQTEELVSLAPESFDAGVSSFDYEHSAFLVRFLLLDPELGPRFRLFLAALAEGEPAGAAQLQSHLIVSWPELDRRFWAWLRRVA